ncbi:MAG: cbb3-type cytochrome c oxidase N-terminal domain-containing protein [Acidobacteriota bacterium]|nr:cbb3-type cytochrome c oxidase N-terminal domain-containing protein [Acidobacteriota bacterium]
MSEQDKVREHTYDGIQEFDNRLPNWWLWILYGSIVFSVAYWILFHTLAVIPHPTGRYEADMRAAEKARLAQLEAGGVTNESLAMMATMEDAVAEGRSHFQTYCVVCHADQGQGLVGPNLTDEYWLHGGSPMEIRQTIMEGVPSKGMAAWGGQLGPRRVEQAVAYLLTIRNTHVEGRPPEGDLYVPGGEVSEQEAEGDVAGGEAVDSSDEGADTPDGETQDVVEGEAAST